MYKTKWIPQRLAMINMTAAWKKKGKNLLMIVHVQQFCERMKARDQAPQQFPRMRLRMERNWYIILMASWSSLWHISTTRFRAVASIMLITYMIIKASPPITPISASLEQFVLLLSKLELGVSVMSAFRGDDSFDKVLGSNPLVTAVVPWNVM